MLQWATAHAAPGRRRLAPVALPSRHLAKAAAAPPQPAPPPPPPPPAAAPARTAAARAAAPRMDIEEMDQKTTPIEHVLLRPGERGV
jgi:hypothetical protein